jgi:hypothetical protein
VIWAEESDIGVLQRDNIVEINPQAGEYYDRMLDCITRKKQLFNEATASNSASIDTDCGVRHTLGIQLPHTEMQIETRDVNKSCCCVLFFSWWPLLQRSTSKKQLTALGL